MKSEKYDRTINLYCPICASLEFESEDSERVICSGCNTGFERAELILQNSESIDAHKKEIAEEVARDLKKQLKDAFKGNSFIKVK